MRFVMSVWYLEDSRVVPLNNTGATRLGLENGLNFMSGSNPATGFVDIDSDATQSWVPLFGRM